MLIIILGANELCTELANSLSRDGHDICVVSEHGESLEHIQQFIDCQTIIGCPSHPHILKAANAENAEMLIAATNNDEMNMIACQVGYSIFKIPRKIAFISNAHYWARNELFGNNNLPIDTIISLDNIIAEQLSELITFSTGFLYDNFTRSDLNIGITTIKNLEYQAEIGPDFKILSAFREQEPLDLETDCLMLDDKILFICFSKNLKSYVEHIYGPRQNNKKIMLGASQGIIDAFCNNQNNHYIKLVADKAHDCTRLAAKHPDATVLHGHITEHELLSNESLNKIEFFCAITNDDEDNIMAALQAKELGAKKTIAMIKKNQYRSMLENSTIDYILDPNQKVLEHVLAHIKHPWIKKIHQIPKTEYKLVELVNPREINTLELGDHKILACINANNVTSPKAIIAANSTILILTKENSLLNQQ